MSTNTNTASDVEDVAGQNSDHLALGRIGEELAAEFLEGSGFALVAANYSVPAGRNIRGAIVTAEIDIVAYEQQTLCFVEVKTRRDDWFAQPEANVDLRKQRQIIRAARIYRRILGLAECSYRYDVVSVIIPDLDFAVARPRITLLRNYWNEEKFRQHIAKPREFYYD